MRFLKRHWKAILIGLGLALGAVAAYAFWPATEDLSGLADAGAAYDARILRDTWGVPHIFGRTDADAAYGLAYAHAEDDFLTIQQTLAAARGQLAGVYGYDAAPNDYMVHLLRIWDVVDAGYLTELSPETRAVVEAYAAGLNHYAALHPREALSGLFPVNGKDIIAGSVHKSPLFFGLDKTLTELFADERQQPVQAVPASALMSVDMAYGSNTFGVSPQRALGGLTLLAVNSHQPWTGPVAWYEAHVHSEEGLDMTGGTFPGVPVIIHGHNRVLGWGFTVNHPDLVDVYVMDINPDNPNQYRFDGQWLDLEVRQAPIRVRLLGRLVVTVRQEVLWSVYGPVVRRPHGTYAVRYAGMGRLGIFEQLYRMNKARDLEEWQAALSLGQLPMFNAGYADRAGNIAYVYNGLLPVRAPGYDWSQYLPGDTSRTLWTEYLPFDQLPMVVNPESGFFQNANSTPFETTAGPGNPDPADYAPAFGIETYMTNRSLRLMSLLSEGGSITWDGFVAIKYDMAYAPGSDPVRLRDMVAAASLPADPDVRAARDVLAAWDGSTAPDSRGTALAVMTLYELSLAQPDAISWSTLTRSRLEPPAVAEAFVRAVSRLKRDFGRVDVAWQEVNRLRRGDADLGLGGAMDVVHAVYGSVEKDGRLRGISGDSYILLVAWDAAGRVSSQALHQFGSATLRPESPHYADQAPLFARRELRPVWLDEADIRAHLEREYRPGE